MWNYWFRNFATIVIPLKFEWFLKFPDSSVPVWNDFNVHEVSFHCLSRQFIDVNGSFHFGLSADKLIGLLIPSVTKDAIFVTPFWRHLIPWIYKVGDHLRIVRYLAGMAVTRSHRMCLLPIFTGFMFIWIKSSSQFDATSDVLSHKYRVSSVFSDNFRTVYRSTTVVPCASVYNMSPVLLLACQSGVPYRPRP